MNDHNDHENRNEKVRYLTGDQLIEAARISTGRHVMILLVAIPALAKWHFRKNLDFTQIDHQKRLFCFYRQKVVHKSITVNR